MATKPSIYILHGWTQDITKWELCVNLLKSAGYKVKLLTIPGLTEKLDKPWNLDNYVQWFKHQVADDRKILVVAHSFGGRVAIRFDVKNPNVIQKLVLIDSAGIRPRTYSAIVKRMSFKALAKIGKRITQNPKARKVLYQLAGERDYYKANTVLAQTMSNIVEEDQQAEIPFVKAHTLILWGSHDTITPLSDGRLMSKMITGSTMKIINDAKHSPHYTHPEEVVDHILKFFPQHQ